MCVLARFLVVFAAAVSVSPLAVAQSSSGTDAGAALGLTLALSGTARDTAGMLVTSILPGGPADEAGISENDRIAELAGVSLRVDPADVGQYGVTQQMSRRVLRAMRAIGSAEEVSVRVVSGLGERTLVMPLFDVTSRPRYVGETRPTRAGNAPSGAAALFAATTTPRAPQADSDVALPAVTDALERQRLSLRRLARAEDDEERGDSLLAIEQELREIVRRLKAVQLPSPSAETPASANTPATASPTPAMAIPEAHDGSGTAGEETVPGLRLATISTETPSSMGTESEGGMLVVEADLTWLPVRRGDIIVRIDGVPVDIARLREAMTASRPVAVEILRQQRRMILTLHEGGV